MIRKNRLWLPILLLFAAVQLSFSQNEFVIGEFTVSKILDGDTFRFEGLDKSTRLMGIDTEDQV